MTTRVSVTVPDTSIVHHAAREVRAIFPSATLNEILRYCALSVTVGTRKAKEMVFESQHTDIAERDRFYADLPDEEHELIHGYVKGGLTVADLYRRGLYQIGGESPDEAKKLARMPRGNGSSRKTKVAG